MEMWKIVLHFIQENSARFNNYSYMYGGGIAISCGVLLLLIKMQNIVKRNMHCFKFYNLNTGNEFSIDMF